MTATKILSTLRDLHVGIVCPPNETNDALALQLIRIGCSVRQFWPPPRKFDTDIDIIFCCVFEGRYHDDLSRLILNGGHRMTAVALVEYESPTVLSQILELGCDGVIVLPLASNMVLPALVCARRNSEAYAKVMLKNALLQDRLENQSDINKAKVLLMSANGLSEDEAHSYLSKEAMKSREPLLDVARKIINHLK